MLCPGIYQVAFNISFNISPVVIVKLALQIYALANGSVRLQLQTLPKFILTDKD
jgi:hypothetical protein